MKLCRNLFLKLFAAVMLLWALALPQNAQAASVDDLYFELNDAEDGYLVAYCDHEAAGDLVIPATYEGLPVVGISGYAFLACDKLTGITIPQSVTAIDGYAFAWCENLSSIEIPAGVTTIGDSAFEACKSLTYVTLPDSVTTIGDYVFYGCEGLTGVTLPKNITAIADGMFCGCTGLTDVTIPSGVTTIGTNAFWNCESLTAITIPKSVTNIEAYGFGWCYGLTDIQVEEGNSVYHSAGNCVIETATKTLAVGRESSRIPADGSVTGIGEYAFAGCVFESFTVPRFITRVAGNAFYQCYYLSKLQVEEGNSIYHSAGNCVIETAAKTLTAGCGASQIPTDGSVTKVGARAFEGCNSLYAVTVPKEITAIGEYAFWECYNLSDLTIASGVETVGEAAFGGCEALTKVAVPNSVTALGDYAFYCCYALTDITLPNRITALSEGLFYGCESLTGLVIPGSVSAIGQRAFAGCGKLTEVIYCGAQAKWDAMEKGGHNEPLAEAQIRIHNYVNGVCSICGQGDSLLGDANGDGKVNLRDAIMVLQASNGKDITIDRVAADVNGDGKVNLQDAIRILKRANGNKDPFPAEK